MQIVRWISGDQELLILIRKALMHNLLVWKTPGAAGSATAPSTSGYKELIFTNDEPIVLQPGQGVALEQLNAGDADFRVKILFEWREVDSSSTPSSQGEYLMTTGPVTASLNSGYVYSSFFNPTDSGKNYVVKRIGIRVNRNVTSSTALAYIPATLRKISSASNGTTISTADVPQKHASTTVTTADIRHTDVTVGFDNSATSSRLLGVTVPGAINQSIGVYETEIIFGDELILAPGEGIALYQETSAIDTAFRFRFTFEWSESDIDYKFVQSGYRIFQNIDSTSVGPPLAAQNTTTTVLYGNQFRLRLLIHVSSSTLAINGQDFKLQFVDMGSGTCASPSGGNPSSYIDVTSTTAIAYYNNPTPSDGAALTATTTDPTHGGDTIVNQTYEEANNFTNSQAAISFGEDGLWDFSLRDYAASTSTTYCLRIVEADNTLFYNYEFYPAINFVNIAPTINSATDAPDPVTVGNQITFTVDWEDQNSDNTRTFVCKSDGFYHFHFDLSGWLVDFQQRHLPPPIRLP
ncbi:MAG: hypothetical protein KatS3mg027_2545 [Bacteroidia bacterium]|nr:MAG: hypothetical protein KatS3mg027_2545 [Bacteroidia bacterium]